MPLNASQLTPDTQPPAPHCSARTRSFLQSNLHLTVHLPYDCDRAVQPGIHVHVCHAASAPGPPAAHAARLAAAAANAMASTPLYSNPGHSTAAHDWGAPATAQLPAPLLMQLPLRLSLAHSVPPLLLLAALLAPLPTRLLEAPHCAPLAEAHMAHSHGSDSHTAHSHAPLAEAHSEAHSEAHLTHSPAPLAEARSAARAGCQNPNVWCSR